MSAHQLLIGFTIMKKAYQKLLKCKDFYKKSEKSLHFMLLLGLLPFLRYFVLNNHSYLHEIFTYRALASTILALFAILWYSMEFFPKKKKRRKRGRNSGISRYSQPRRTKRKITSQNYSGRFSAYTIYIIRL